MASGAVDIYLGGLAFVSAVVNRYPDDGWDLPSPCAGWRALDVLGRLGATTLYGVELLRHGQASWQPAAVPGDAVGDDPRGWWDAMAGDAGRVISGTDTARVIDTPTGARRVGDGLSFPAVDLYVHAWDIARSAGMDVAIPEAAIDFAHAVLDPLPVERLRRPATFAPEIPVGAGADATAAFVAWTARDPRWTAPA